MMERGVFVVWSLPPWAQLRQRQQKSASSALVVGMAHTGHR